MKSCLLIITAVLSFSAKADVDPSAYRGIVIREGHGARFRPLLPVDVQYRLNDKGYEVLQRVDHIHLTYHVWTEDGTAKAHKDYLPLEERNRHKFVWANQPYAQSRDHWGDHLKVGGHPDNWNGIQTYINDDDRDKYPNGSKKYFYVVLAYPWLEMSGRWCKEGFWNMSFGCSDYERSERREHLSEWADVLKFHNTPNQIKFAIYIEQH